MGLDPSDVNTNPNHYADGGAATAEPITVTGTAVGNYGTVYPSVIAQGLPSVLGGPPVSNAGVSALDDPTIPTAEPVIVNDTPIKPSQPKRKGPSPVTVGDYFDLGRLRLQLYNYGLANAEQIKSEIRFIEMVNNGAGAYSAGTLAAIVGGEALAGTSAASGPPQNITPILRLIFQIMAGWEQGPPPIEPLPPPPDPVAEGPVIPGG